MIREQIKERIQEYRDTIESETICFHRAISDNPKDILEIQNNYDNYVIDALSRIQELEWVLNLIPEKTEVVDSFRWFDI